MCIKRSLGVALLAIGACRSDRPDTQLPQTMAASSTIAGARPATHSTPPAADSFSFPGGYYSPNEDVEVNGQELAWLELRQHGDPRTLAHRYPAQLWIAPAGTEDFGQYRCADPLIRRDTLDVYCETSPIGTVRIRGSFNEVLRPGWE